MFSRVMLVSAKVQEPLLQTSIRVECALRVKTRVLLELLSYFCSHTLFSLAFKTYMEEQSEGLALALNHPGRPALLSAQANLEA